MYVQISVNPYKLSSVTFCQMKRIVIQLCSLIGETNMCELYVP